MSQPLLVSSSLLSLVLAAVAAGQNMVKNGDFEADLTSWTGSGPGGSPWQGAQIATTGNTLGLTAAINFY